MSKPQPAPVREPRDITWLVTWTFQQQRADGAVGLEEAERRCAGMIVRKISGDGCYRVEQVASLGTHVDGGGYAARHVHADAELILSVIERMPSRTRSMLSAYGRTGAVPDWMPGQQPKLEPVFNRKGKPEMIRDKSDHGIACRVRVVLRQESINHAHAVYVVWWDALADLQKRIQAIGLSAYSATGPDAPREPWLNPLDILRSTLDFPSAA